MRTTSCLWDFVKVGVFANATPLDLPCFPQSHTFWETEEVNLPSLAGITKSDDTIFLRPSPVSRGYDWVTV